MTALQNEKFLARKQEFPDVKVKSVYVYHYVCADGVASAFVCWLNTEDKKDFKAFPLPNESSEKYEENILNNVDEETVVYFLDCRPGDSFFEKIYDKVFFIYVFDHHIGNLRKLQEWSKVKAFFDYVYEKESSGCKVTKQALGLIEASEHDQLLDYIEDADLWRFKLSQSKEFSAGLKCMRLEYDYQKNPAIFEILKAVKIEAVLAAGFEEILKHEKRLDELIKYHMKYVSVSYTNQDEPPKNKRMFMAYVQLNVSENPSDWEIVSKLGERMAQMADQELSIDKELEMSNYNGSGSFMLILDKDKYPNTIPVKFRSTKENNVREVAEFFGGSGHDQACGAEVPNDHEFFSKLLTVSQNTFTVDE